MNPEEFNKLIDKDKYQVFLLLSSANFPFTTFYHPWFVINQKGKLSRFEVKRNRNANRKLGYIHINAQPLFQGLPLFVYINKFFQKTTLLKMIEGDENSIAKSATDFIENSKEIYPLKNKYSLWGPNCATYVEWILEKFPELQVKLPWNAIGKNYKN